jgi:hypothetical protein
MFVGRLRRRLRHLGPARVVHGGRDPDPAQEPDRHALHGQEAPGTPTDSSQFIKLFPNLQSPSYLTLALTYICSYSYTFTIELALGCAVPDPKQSFDLRTSCLNLKCPTYSWRIAYFL